MTVQSFPVHRSDFWDLSPPQRADAIEQWYAARRRQQPERVLAEAFRNEGCQEWIARTTQEWQLVEIPPTELSESVGISTSQASRWINHASVSLGVLNLHAGLTRQAYPRPDLVRTAIYGLPPALARTAWLDQTATTRGNRTPVPTAESLSQVGLAVTLFRSPFVEAWHRLTVQYAADLTAAENDPALHAFLSRFTQEVERLTNSFPPGFTWTIPKSAVPDRPIDHGWNLCRQLNRLWQSYHRLWPIMWQRLGQFTPWSIWQD